MTSTARDFRNRAGLSIEAAAKQLGIPAGYLSDIERGRRHVSAERAAEIASLYGAKVEQIFLPLRYALREVEKVTQ